MLTEFPINKCTGKTIKSVAVNDNCCAIVFEDGTFAAISAVINETYGEVVPELDYKLDILKWPCIQTLEDAGVGTWKELSGWCERERERLHSIAKPERLKQYLELKKEFEAEDTERNELEKEILRLDIERKKQEIISLGEELKKQ